MRRRRMPCDLASLAVRFLDNPAEFHELSADLEPGSLHGRDVDVEADLLVLHAERDLSAAGREVIDFADRQDRRSLEGLQDGGETIPLRGADEEDVARARVPDVSEPLDDDPSVVNGLAAERVIEDGAEGVRPEDPDDQRLAAPGERLGRPGHEGREVVEVGGLDLVLGETSRDRFVPTRPAPAGDQDRGQAQKQGAAAQPGALYHRRTILPYTLRSTSIGPAPPPPNSA